MSIMQPTIAPKRFLPCCLFALSFVATFTTHAQKLPEGFQSALFADSSQVGNIVAMTFDDQDRLLATEITRRETGVWGVTFSRWWAMEDYRGQSLETREAMYDRWAHVVPPAMLTRNADRIRMLQDSNRDGIADQSSLYADGFNERLAGNAAGILAVGNDVYFAEIPSIWKLKDTDGDGIADERKELHRGFGVRVGVHAHDLHGLIMGPDGRIYFTVGDRGFNVLTHEGKRLKAATRGAVFRCFPDGSKLEVFHHGLRNPQEIAFNQHGDLFTVDNDMGGGDSCRILYLMEGADSAWYATYQLTRNFREETDRKDHPQPPWFSERLWDLPHKEQPLWHNKPLGHLTHGPSGLAYYPGTGFPEEYQDTFFICDFVGSSARSGIRTFKLQQEGAGYALQSTNIFAWQTLATDIAFSKDGQLYYTDWINGWGGNGERVIKRTWHPEARETAAAKSTDRWLHKINNELSINDLIEMLRHPDQRVRHKAQFAIAERKEGQTIFRSIILKEKQELPLIHSLWGLWQMGLLEKNPASIRGFIHAQLDQLTGEARVQAIKVLADLPDTPGNWFVPLLEEETPRVRYHALMGLGRHGNRDHLQHLRKAMVRLSPRDWSLQHAVVTALCGAASPGDLAGFSRSPDPMMRLMGLLALRRMESDQMSHFLEDEDPPIQYEAIRGLHDNRDGQLWRKLTAMIQSPLFHNENTPFPIRHRILNARFRSGGQEDALAVADVATNSSLGMEIRKEALQSLLKWDTPSDFDRVTWDYRPLDGKRSKPNLGSRTPKLVAILDEKSSGNLPSLAAELLARLNLTDKNLSLGLAARKDLPVSARIPFLQSHLGTNPDPATLKPFLEDPEWQLRLDTAVHLIRRKAAGGTQALITLLNTTKGTARSEVIRKAGSLEGTEIEDWFGSELKKGLKERSAHLLDVYLSSPAASELAANKEALQQHLKTSDPEHGLHLLTLNGGDPKAGEDLFLNHAVQCVRCHRIKRFGGEAGPDLSKIGKALKPVEILEALIEPSKRIAPGFAFIEFELPDDDLVGGFVQEENDQEVTVRTMDGKIRSLKKETILNRSQPASAMPGMKEALSLKEIQNLIAYLKTLK